MRNPNEMPPRAAMGLPSAFVDRLGSDLMSRHADLLDADVKSLVSVVESTTAATQRRFAAGIVLALRGDPRISVAHPQMIALPGGEVRLGLPAADIDRVVAEWEHRDVRREWICKESPDYVCSIRPFAIARFPVTNFEYRKFLDATKSKFLPTSWQFGIYPLWFANHPVWTISPEAADAYAAWLSDLTGRRFRLPNEAEWEYAASLDDGREFPWGERFEEKCANTVENGPLTTTPVGMYPLGRSKMGLDDLGGNVEEYTSSNYAAYPDGQLVVDDLQEICGTYRVARGGSFTRYGDLARCKRRHGWYPGAIYAMGFRLAEST
jgi:formylglycine-generating enzyme required for sulfatase activity